MKRRLKFQVLFFSFIIVFGISYVGSIFTLDIANSPWYNSIKPSITPPSYVFPIVWNILFFLIALSLYFSWINSRKKEQRQIGSLFLINLILNALWSYIFFSLKNTRLAFYELIILWISILSLIIYTKDIDSKAAWLLVPYLLWVSFAGVLNYLIAFS